ncbi:MAG: hypothetical protein OCD76_07475 [Reichenbachiella sp.]
MYESQYFLLEEQGLPLERVLELRVKLLDKADNLATTHDHYQEEEYLKHLVKNHRRAIEGYFKIVYRVYGDVIYITDFFDARQDPSKMRG